MTSEQIRQKIESLREYSAQGFGSGGKMSDEIEKWEIRFRDKVREEQHAEDLAAAAHLFPRLTPEQLDASLKALRRLLK